MKRLRPRFQALRTLFKRPTNPRLPKIETIWLPYYLIHVAGGDKHITVSVEGFTGTFAIYEMSSLQAGGASPGPSFEPRLSPQQAEHIGRRELLGALLRMRGNRRKLQPGETLAIDLLHYPFHIYYYERAQGFIDFRILDAVNGEKRSGKTKTAVLNAFMSRQGDASTATI